MDFVIYDLLICVVVYYTLKEIWTPSYYIVFWYIYNLDFVIRGSLKYHSHAHILIYVHGCRFFFFFGKKKKKKNLF